MPYETQYVPAPRDLTLPVLPQPPVEAVIHRAADWNAPYDTARAPSRWFYKCRHCDGWIEGHAGSYRENTLAPLSGRSGTAYHCIRCGEEIGFSGMVS